MQSITRLITVVALGALGLLTLSGCERLGFESEPAPEATEDEDAAQPEPDEPWREPPADWSAPSTDLLAYDISADEPREADSPTPPPTQSDEPTPDARVLLTRDAIIMENISALMLRTPEERQAIAARADDAGHDSIWMNERRDFDDGSISASDLDGAFKLSAVSDFIEDVSSLMPAEKTAPNIELDVHPESPYVRLYSVAYSVWQAAPQATLLMRARRDTGDGAVFTLTRATSRTTSLGECDPEREPCAQPHVEFRDSGLQIRAAPGIPEPIAEQNTDERADGEQAGPDADGKTSDQSPIPCLPGQEAADEGDLPRFASDTDWTNRVMLLDEALCPSVPSHDDGSLDTAGLVELFNDIEAMAPGCRRATWTAGTDVTWEVIGPIVGHASAQSSFDQVQFDRPLPPTSPSPRCKEGMKPTASQER